MSYSPEPQKTSRLARFLPFLHPPHPTYEHLMTAGFGHGPSRRALKHSRDPVEATKWATHYAHRESGHPMFLLHPGVCAVCADEDERQAARAKEKADRDAARAKEKTDRQAARAKEKADRDATRAKEAAEAAAARKRARARSQTSRRTTTSSSRRDDGGYVGYSGYSGHSHSCSGGGGGGGDSGGGAC